MILGKHMDNHQGHEEQVAWTIVDWGGGEEEPPPVFFVARHWIDAKLMARMYFGCDVPNDATWKAISVEAAFEGGDTVVQRAPDGTLVTAGESEPPETPDTEPPPPMSGPNGSNGMHLEDDEDDDLDDVPF